MERFRSVLKPCLVAVTLLAAAAEPALGGLIGGNVTLSSNSCAFPDAAYSSTNDKYLVVWADYNYSPQRVFGRFVTNAGDASGSAFQISDGSAYALYPAVAYNATNNEFLVTWDGGQGETIVGQRVRASDGALLGGNFTIGGVWGGIRSSVAWSATSNVYLVVYYAVASYIDVFARRVSNTGGLLGSDINVSSDADYSGYPSVAWASSGNQFLVTWDYNPSGTNWGYIDAQRIDASTGSKTGSKIAIARSGYNDRSQVCYDTVNNRWLVQFQEAGNPGYSYDQYGQFVNTDGTLNGSNFPIAHTTNFEGETLLGCDIAFVPGYGGRFFSSFPFESSTSNMGLQELYASGTLLGPQVTLASNSGGYMSNAADTELNRCLTVWTAMEAGYPIRSQLYEASATAPPGPIINFAATPGTGQNSLSWTNPGEPTFSGTMIRCKTTGYPTSTTDGTLVVDKSNTPGSNDSYTHTGLTNEVTYYYTAWAHSSTPDYSLPTNASATPSMAPGLMIIPKPQEWTWKTGLTGFLINSSTQIMANSSPDSKEQNTAQQLQRKIWDMTGCWPTISYGGSSTSNVIAIGDPSRCPAVSSIISTWSEASGKTSKSEGYMLGVKDTSIVIRGWDNAGTFYGCQTLIQLLEYAKTSTIPALFSYDYPELPWRGMYFRIKYEHDWAFTKEIISEVVARYKMNRILPDVSVYWSSHPELPTQDPNYPQDANVLDMHNFARLHYITDIQGVNAWVFGFDGTLHTDLKENQAIPVGDPNNLCMRNPNARALLNDLWDEVRSDFGGSYMHTGQSEYSQLGWDSCPYCGPYSNVWLFSDFLTKDRNDLYADHGITPIIWGDMLNPNQGGGPTHWNTADAVDTMPSETIIFDWLYDVYTDYTSLDIWTSHGKKACGTPFGFGVHPEYGQYYGDKENIYYWAKSVNDRRASYPNLMLGIVAFNKYTANDKRITFDTPLQMDQLEEWPFVAEWSWNPEGRNWQPVYPFDGKAMVKRELAPEKVTNFAANPSGSNVNLSWTNPTDATFTAVRIVYKTSGYPSGPNDGTLLVDKSGSPGANDSYTHSSAPQTVYYAAFAHDNVKHYATAATAKVGGYCFEDQFSYSNGALVGQGGWTGSATSAQIAIDNQTVKIMGGSGSYDAIHTTNCGADASGYITVTCKINGEVGDATMWNLWIDDSAAKNLARWYGTGTTARGRIGSTSSVTATQTLTGGWDTLKVKIHPLNNTSEFFFNGTSIGTLDHSVTGAGDAVGRLRLERISNSGASGHYLYFDELTIGVLPEGPDTTPPGPVSNFTATAGDTQVSLSWNNPGDSDFAGTRILYKTTGYPASPTDGTVIYSGSGTSYAHTGLTNGTPYYYAAYAYDEVPNYSTAANASATPTAEFCFRDIFLYPNGALNGNGGWSGSAGASQIEVIDEKVRIWGGATSYDAIKTMSCDEAGRGYIMVRILAYPGQGTDSTMWSMWVDDASGNNFGRWYGKGNTARGRIGGTADVTAEQTLVGGGTWNSLVMKIVPSANTTQFFFDGANLGTFSHASQGTGDVIGRIRFERINNSGASGHNMYLDDLRVGGN